MNYVKTGRLRAEKRITQSIHGRTCLELAEFFRDYAAQYPGSKVSTPATSVFVVRDGFETDADMAARHVIEEAAHFANLTEAAVKSAVLADRVEMLAVVGRGIRAALSREMDGTPMQAHTARKIKTALEAVYTEMEQVA